MSNKVKSRVKKPKNYAFIAVISKILQPVLNILFYITAALTVFLIILSVIVFFVNMPVDEMLLPPFMSRTMIEEATASPSLLDVEYNAYNIHLGNGVKITTLASNVTLDNIKAALFAEIIVLIFTFLTIAPIFKFLAAFLKNINAKEYFHARNARYIMFIGLCVSVGTIVIRFASQFYNYHLLKQFMILTDASPTIALSLRVDILSGMTGVVIIFFGLIYAYICQMHTIEIGYDSRGGGNAETPKLIEEPKTPETGNADRK